MTKVGFWQKEFMVSVLTTVLSMQGRVNYTQLSARMPYHAYSIKRWFHREFNFKEFNENLLREENMGGRVIAVIDASFIRKSGKHTAGKAWFHNGCASRMEKGLELSGIALVYEDSRQGFMLDVKQTVDDSLEEGKSRIDGYAKHLQSCLAYLPDAVKYVAADGYYAKRSFVDAVLDESNVRTVHLISKLRCDANLKYLVSEQRSTQTPAVGPKQRGRPKKYVGKVDLSTLENFEAIGELLEGVEGYTCVCQHVQLKRKIKVLVLKPKQGSQVILFSTDIHIDAKDVLALYQLRFQIEFLFRDAKQHTGLSHCQARDEQALTFHFNMALSSVNLAKLDQLSEHQSPDAFVFSLARYKEQQMRQRLLNVFIDNLALDPSDAKIQAAITACVQSEKPLKLAA